MNAALQLDPPARASELGHLAWQLDASFQRRLEFLRTAPVTHEQYLTGKVQHGLDFASLDSLTREVAAFLAEHGDVPFVMEAAQTSLAPWLERLDTMASTCARYRKLK